MIEKIKENPKKVLGIVAGVLFLGAILFMHASGLTLSGEVAADVNMKMTAPLFSFIFGGLIMSFGSGGSFKQIECTDLDANIMSLIAGILTILIFVGSIVLIFGILSDKFNKKTRLIIAIILAVLAITVAILFLTSKNSMLRTSVISSIKAEGEEVTEEAIKHYLENVQTLIDEGWKLSIGAGTIVSSVLMILGGCSLGGVAFLSAKEAK